MSNISARIDKLPSTKMLRQILILTGIGWMFDAMDQGMVAGIMVAIGKEWHLTAGQLGQLGSISMLGMGLGAALSGMVADKFGRRTVIMLTLIMYGVSSIISGFAINYPMLLVLRFLTGFGLGGELPAASTLISEFSPTKIRGRNVIFLESFWAWGWILASLISYLLIPNYGWRLAFIVGGVPALFAAIIRQCIPESPRYLEAVGKVKEADDIVGRMELQAGIVGKLEVKESKDYIENIKKFHVTFIELWSKKYIRSTIVLWIIWFGINFGYYGFVLWTPSILVTKGLSLVKSLEFQLIMSLAQLPGYFSAAYLVERIGRKHVLSIYFLGTAVAAWLFGHAGNTNEVLIFGCLLYFFSLGAWGCVYAYTPEVYPTVARASGSGWASAFGRIGAFLAPLILPVVYSSYGSENGFTFVFILLAAVFGFVAIVVTILGKETMGKALEEISQE